MHQLPNINFFTSVQFKRNFRTVFHLTHYSNHANGNLGKFNSPWKVGIGLCWRTPQTQSWTYMQSPELTGRLRRIDPASQQVRKLHAESASRSWTYSWTLHVSPGLCWRTPHVVPGLCWRTLHVSLGLCLWRPPTQSNPNFPQTVKVFFPPFLQSRQMTCWQQASPCTGGCHQQRLGNDRGSGYSGGLVTWVGGWHPPYTARTGRASPTTNTQRAGIKYSELLIDSLAVAGISLGGLVTATLALV